jgi:hypothetical protein
VRVEKWEILKELSEPEFVNVSGAQESIPWNRLLGPLNVLKFVLWCKVIFKYIYCMIVATYPI